MTECCEGKASRPSDETFCLSTTPVLIKLVNLHLYQSVRFMTPIKYLFLFKIKELLIAAVYIFLNNYLYG